MASLAVLFLSSCYRDNEEEFYQNIIANCDTAAVSYSAKVVPILSNKCYVCHSAAAAPASGGGTVLEGHTALTAYLAGTNKLLSAIKQDGSASSMPQGGTKLDACSISMIESWMNQGKLNN